MDKKRGFTFVELLVSVTIMAVMMAAAVVSYSGTNKRSRDAKRKADLEMIRSALEICRSNTGVYPAGPITASVQCSDGATTLSVTPSDPLNPATNHTTYTYNRTSTTTYTLSANLELPSDPTAYTLSNP